MEQSQLSQQALEYLTRCLRHAVSNGQYLTAEILEQAIAEYNAEHAQTPHRSCTEPARFHFVDHAHSVTALTTKNPVTRQVAK
jgi:hypothetical protein